MLSVPGAVHYVAGDIKDFFFPHLKMDSSTLSLFCKMSEIKRASSLVAMHLLLRGRAGNDCQYPASMPLQTVYENVNQILFATVLCVQTIRQV